MKTVVYKKWFVHLYAVSAIGSSWSPRLSNLRYEASQAVPPLGGADPGRSVRQCHLSLWSGLLCAAQAPEDYWRSTCFYCDVGGIWAHGAGERGSENSLSLWHSRNSQDFFFFYIASNFTLLNLLKEQSVLCLKVLFVDNHWHFQAWVHHVLTKSLELYWKLLSPQKWDGSVF